MLSIFQVNFRSPKFLKKIRYGKISRVLRLSVFLFSSFQTFRAQRSLGIYFFFSIRLVCKKNFLSTSETQVMNLAEH